jgi:hypothetical protein
MEMPLRRIHEAEELLLSPEDKYHFLNGKTYKCLSCHAVVTHRLQHILEFKHNSFKDIKNE